MKVVVVGGGVVGLWCARELLAAGAEVTVLANTSAEAAVSTPASAGWVVPVLSSPLASPGVVGRSLRQLSRGQAAFSLPPAMSPELARWLWAFLRSGSAQRYREGLRATLEMASSSVDQYIALRDSGLPVELYRDGLLLVTRTPAGMHEATELVESAATAGYDGKYDVLDRDQLLHLQPALSADVHGGIHARDELHVRPESLVSALQNDLLDKGGEVHHSTTVQGVVPNGNGRWTVTTERGPFQGDRVVVAAGYWSKMLLARLGVHIPLQSAAGVSITATGPAPPSLPLKLVEANVAATPFDGGLRLAGRFALGSRPSRASARQVRRVLTAASPYLRAWTPVDVTTQNVGLRPVTPDSLPLVGELPTHRGIFTATGHGMLGLTLAPGTAREIRHQIETDTPSDPGTALSVDRFLKPSSRGR